LDLIGFSAATTADWLCPLQAFTALGAATPFLSPLIYKKHHLPSLSMHLNSFHTLCLKTEN